MTYEQVDKLLELVDEEAIRRGAMLRARCRRCGKEITSVVEAAKHNCVRKRLRLVKE